ncbi:hypothetical protein V8G54_001984, partial [Vigna mungo]
YTNTMHHSHQYPLPCLYCHPHSYIRMVQSLIERCMLFHMSQEQCIRALAEHAGIKPLVTVTVWKELQKENREFFREYLQVDIFKGHQNWLEENPGTDKVNGGS